MQGAVNTAVISSSVVRLSADLVYQTLIRVSSPDAAIRKPAEEQLAQWESGSTKGFLASLMEIVAKGRQVEDQARLLACIVAKNAVGSSWRKTLGTREWTKVDQEEKVFLRHTLPEILISEPNNQIAVQIALFLSNIVRFDFPKEWPDILQTLVNVLLHPPNIDAAYRCTVALKNIFKALQTKVTLTSGFSMEAVQSAVKEAKEMPQRVAQQFPAIVQQCKHHLTEFAKATPTWKTNAAIALELLAVVEHCILLVPDIEVLEPSLETFFVTILDCSQAQFKLMITPFESNFQEYFYLIAKCFFKNMNCILTAFEKHAIKFCKYLLPFLRHYTEVLARFPRTSPFFTSRHIMKLTRYITMVMVCPFFRHQFWITISPMLDSQDNKFKQAHAVYEGINDFFSKDCLHALLESLIQNHLRLTEEEIEAWETEPELYLKESEATDGIHCYSEELLIALFVRCSDEIRDILLEDARKLQQHPNVNSDDIIFLLDACYRAIGVSRSGTNQVLDINKWYDTELRGRIEKPQDCILLRDRVLLCRSLWLLRRFSARVNAEISDQIILSIITCINSSDLVVSMQAIRTLHSFLILRQRREGADTLPIGHIVKECFNVLPKLKETENRVHILDLVSQLIRIVGYRVIEPHLEEIISYLPALWSNLPSPDANVESGGEVRLQKSLVTLTSNLIQAIGPSALENPKVGELSLGLLRFTTNPKGQQALNMLTEGIQLWNAIMNATPRLAPALLELYPRLFEIIQPSVEPAAALPLLKAYVLLGSHLLPNYASQISHAVDQIIGRCEYQESILCADLLETLLILRPMESTNWFLDPTLRRLTRDLVEGEAIDRTNAEKKRLVPREAMAFSCVLARIVAREPVAFSMLCSDHVEAQQKLLERWMGCITGHSIEELFSTYASLSGIKKRKIICAALMMLLDAQNHVVIEQATKIMQLVQSVGQQADRLSSRASRFLALRKNQQLDRELETRVRELELNDPMEDFDIIANFQRLVKVYPIPEPSRNENAHYLPIMELQ